MERYIERAGGPLPALRRIIETDVGDLLYRNLPAISVMPQSEQGAVLQAVTGTLDEVFRCIAHSLYRTYHSLHDELAQRELLSEYQYTTLQLLGHLLEYTKPQQLLEGRLYASFEAACCHHAYRALTSLLDSTIKLAGGQLDDTLPLPPSARTLLQEIIVGDLEVLRHHLEALHVSPALVEIALAPFQALPSIYSPTFYQLHYLGTLKRALLAPPLPGYDVIGDGHVLWTLVAQNYNAPEFIAWFEHVVGAQRGEFDRYKMRLATHPGFSSLGWHPARPTVREQLSRWLELQMVANAGGEDSPYLETPSDIPMASAEERLDDEDEEEYTLDADSPNSLDDLTLRNISPQVFAAIGKAAAKLRYVFWGRNDKHLAEMVARIPSIHGPLRDRTVRRGLRDPVTLRRALEILRSLVHFFERLLKEQEEKSYR
jgi:hypothetical protein